MKNKHLLLIFFLCPICLSTTCIRKTDIENTLYIENRLNHDLYVVANYDYPNPSKVIYAKHALKVNLQYQVSANDSSRVGLWGICQKQVWDWQVPSDTIQILVLNKDSIDNGVEDSFEEYLENEKYIRMYKLTYTDVLENECRLIVE